MTIVLIVATLGLSPAPAARPAVGPLFPITMAPDAPVAAPVAANPEAPIANPETPIANPETPAAAPGTPDPGAAANPGGPDLTNPFGSADADTTAPSDEPPRPTAAGSLPAAAVRETAAPPARPIHTRFDLQLDLATNRVNDPSFLGFSDDRVLVGPGVRLRGDVRLGRGPLFVGGGLGYHYFSTDRTVFQGTLSNSIRLHEPKVHGRLSLAAVEGLDLFVDVSAGPSFVQYTTDNQRDLGGEGSARKTTGTFAGLGGFSLYLPKKWLIRKQASRVTAGLETSFGYQYRGAIDIEPKPKTAEDPIDTTATRFGDVAVRGFYWQLGLFLRFI